MIIEEIDFAAEIGELGRILSEHDAKKSFLINILQKIQKKNGYLPEDILMRLSRRLSLPIAEIYSVASFYKQFHFTPRGRKVVKVCMGTACYVKGAKDILATLENEFGIKSGETTKDLALTLETVGCVGCCGLAPVAVVNEEIVGEIGTSKLNILIKSIREE